MAIKGGDSILEKQNWSGWFFALCAVLFFSYGLSIYQEFGTTWLGRRTYVLYQQRFKDFEISKTRDEFEKFKPTYDTAKEQQLQSAVDEAKKKKAEGGYDDLVGDRKNQFLRVGYAKSERAKVKSNQDALFYEWKHAVHQHHEKQAAEKEAEYFALESRKAGGVEWLEGTDATNPKKESLPWWTLQLEDEQKKLAEIDAKIAAFDDAIKSAEKALAEHRLQWGSYEERLAKIADRSTRNLDQIVNDHLGIGGAYTFGTVDRCRSCHVAIDRPGIDQAYFAKLPDDNPYKKYDKVFSSHPKLGAKDDPYFAKHLIDNYGCTICHQGQGRATRIKTSMFGDPDDFVFATDMDQPHGPASEHGAHQWEQPLYRKQFKTDEHGEIQKDAKGNPVVVANFMHAGCHRCHSQNRWVDGGQDYEQGKDLFIGKGCVGCHVVKGLEDMPRVGPELTRISAKVTPEWLVSWIENPKAFYPNTRMPMFVFDEFQVGAPDPKDNVAVMPERGKQIQRETATKIAAFLWQNSAKARPNPEGSFPGGGNAENGLKVIQTVGCLGCHNVNGKGTNSAPPLEKAGAKMTSADWIWNWVQNPRWHSDTTIMPNLRLTDSETRDVVAYLWQAGQKERPKEDAALRKALEDPKNAEAGGILITQWGCAGCHVIKGHDKDGRIGPEITLFADKKTYELAFGDATNVPQTWLDWTKGKIHNPRQYVDVRSAARMPWFGLSEEEIAKLTVFLSGMKNPRVPDDMKVQIVGRNAQVERGRLLVNQYNCVGCHFIEGRGGEIWAVNKARELRPPNLNVQGIRIRPDYMDSFLKNPGQVKIRPFLEIRMPTFPLSDAERADIVAYFRAADRVTGDDTAPREDAALIAEGAKLFESYRCASCHYWNGKKPGSQDAPELANVWKRFRPDGVEVWLRDPQIAYPGTNMPSFFYSDGVAVPTDKDGNPSPELAEHQIDAIRAFLFSRGPSGSI